jgi:hypothetical protein
MTRKYIRYSLNKQTEVELLLYFCTKLRKLSPPIDRNTTLMNIYTRLTDTVIRKLPLLHEDLQYDYQLEINELNNKAKP